ncbi:sigma-E factor negative regulatory protein [Xanthomonas sp. GPE 39]|uniref:sigma-E factor negative regulatory protein n=1 Tax=Xanthomonas sp. GPE 39 TaxID=1583099 RepID=UPI0005F2C0CE|nr:sigma-E factor negative regulatory protein [Xanthomonas sp. GPE 39]
MTENTSFPQPTPPPGTVVPDKFELHYRQQLSALIDGELPADEARFVLRRLQHDEELAGCHERWQLCGEILRGRVSVPAPADFSARVREAVAAEALQQVHARRLGAAGKRGTWRWSGGVALAASVAGLALFVTGERLSEVPAAVPPAQVASAVTPASAAAASPSPLPAPRPTPVDPQGDLTAAVALEHPARAVAVATPAVAAPVQAAPSFAAPVVAATAIAQREGDPFGHATPALQPRPWPRSKLPQAASGSEFTASFPGQGNSSAAFYPFEPQVSAGAAVASPPAQQP